MKAWILAWALAARWRWNARRGCPWHTKCPITVNVDWPWAGAAVVGLVVMVGLIVWPVTVIICQVRDGY